MTQHGKARPRPAGASAWAVLLLSLFGSLIAACSGLQQVTSAAPPLVVCGVTLSDSPAGALIYEITNKDFNGKIAVNGATVGGVVYVRVADGCVHGSEVTLTPPDGFETVRQVLATDHLPVAVVLRPVLPIPTLLVARQHGRVVGSLKLDMATGGLLGPVGIVTGKLLRVGGPAPGSPVPLPGEVTLTNVTSGTKYATSAGSDGRFDLAVPPGTYQVTAKSPLVHVGTKEMVGRATGPVHVGKGTTKSVKVYFSIR